MFSLIFTTVVTFLTFFSLVSGITITVGGIAYYPSSDVVATISISASERKAFKALDLVPLTVIDGGKDAFGSSELQSIVKSYTASDDVFNTGFLQAIYLKSSGYLDLKAITSIASKSCGTKFFTQGKSNLPAGPYFMSIATGELVQAYRLYSDVQGAFTEGLIPAQKGSYQVLSAAVPGAQSPTIGVPSRLYYTKSASKPLSGVRLGVKDIYDIAGVRTSCGNRAYYNLYPERKTTAVAVQRLIDAGAVIVGKMKTSQFANGETATADWVDYHSPFNARGDGYQDPSSSSSGPGSGIGSYPWLDLALGSDTGGSIRNPSQVNGCFGNRPSFGLVSLTGVMPLSPALDTAGFLCRDASLWKITAKVLYETNVTFYDTFPKKIYTSGFPITATTEAQKVLLDFLAKLKAFLEADVTIFDIDAAWNSTGPVKNTIETFLDTTYPTLISQQQYALLAVPFYADYAKANNGRRPFVNPTPLVRWAWGQKNISADALTMQLERKTVFADWWNGKVLTRDKTTCSNSLFLYPGALANPTYRNVYKSAPGVPTGFGTSRISNFAGVPDMVIPIGQAAYNSTVTLQSEYLPVAIDIMAAKGCDGMIFELAERLQKAGIVKVVGTGSTLYAGADKIFM